MTVTVFPRKTTRFKPGFVFDGHFKITSAAQAQSIWNNNLEAYKTSWRFGDETFLGLAYQTGWEQYYTDTNVRPSNPADPDDPGYNWSVLTDILDNTPFLNDGRGQLVVSMRDRSTPYPYPDWARLAPYNVHVTLDNGWDTFAYHRQTAVTEYSLFAEAFGKKFGSDTRIAYVYGQEAVRGGGFPSDWNSPLGGGSGGFTGQDAWDQGLVSVRSTFAEQMGDGLFIQYHQRIPLAEGIQGNPGMLARGVHLGYPDPRVFWRTCGTGVYPDQDCNGGDDDYWLLQRERDNFATLMSSEPNGWKIVYDTADTWARANPFGYTASSTPSIDTDIFVWYCSGPPRTGGDPPGVIPVSIISCVVDTNAGSGKEFSDYERAINRFGPPGTGAAPYYPVGYPAYSDGSGGTNDSVVKRIICGRSAYVDSAGKQWEGGANYTTETYSAGGPASLTNTTGYDNYLFEGMNLDVGNDNIPFVIDNLTNGTYQLKLGFVEPFWETVGSRVFHIDVNSVRKFTDFDIYERSGLGIALVETLSNISVTSNQLTIDLIDTAADRAVISFIEIIAQEVSQEYTAEEETSPGVYTNRELSREIPSQGTLKITLDKASIVSYADMHLKVVPQQAQQQLRNAKLITDGM